MIVQLLCLKWQFELWFVEMIVRPPYEDLDHLRSAGHMSSDSAGSGLSLASDPRVAGGSALPSGLLSKGIWRQVVGSLVRNSYVSYISTLCPVVNCPYFCTSDTCSCGGTNYISASTSRSSSLSTSKYPISRRRSESRILRRGPQHF